MTKTALKPRQEPHLEGLQSVGAGREWKSREKERKGREREPRHSGQRIRSKVGEK